MGNGLQSSAPHIHNAAGFNGPLKDWGLQPDMIEGKSESRGVLLWKGEGDRPECGLWEVTPGTWPLELPADEVCHFVAGRATYVHENGEEIAIVPGTVVVFPAGWRGICRVRETLRNVYMLARRGTQ